MEVQFAKWGNSLALRVPQKVAEALQISPGSIADLVLKRDKLVITPRSHSYQLDELVAGITDENLHGEVQTGVTMGAEEAD